MPPGVFIQGLDSRVSEQTSREGRSLESSEQQRAVSAVARHGGEAERLGMARNGMVCRGGARCSMACRVAGLGSWVHILLCVAGGVEFQVGVGGGFSPHAYCTHA